MDLPTLIGDFVDDVLGARSAYALTDLHEDAAAPEASAIRRLRLRLYRALLAEGWQAPDQAIAAMARDEQNLLEPVDGIHVAPSRDEDYAAIRARARTARDQRRAAGERNATEKRDASDPSTEVQQMRQAMESRAVIEQAKGIAMERYGIRAEVAWAWLVRTSQQRNIKVRVLAQELVDEPDAGASSA
jgi:ANTAR domain